jgi:hypothetical protein
MKYMITIEKGKMTKTFTDNEGNEYNETWVIKNGCECTNGPSITAFMEASDSEYDEELMDVLDGDDIYEIWDYIEEEDK